MARGQIVSLIAFGAVLMLPGWVTAQDTGQSLRGYLAPKVLAALGRYRACVIHQADNFERSGGTPAEVATAALEKCQDEEAQYMVAEIYDGGVAPTRDDESMRDTAASEVIRIRACRNGSREACQPLGKPNGQ